MMKKGLRKMMVILLIPLIMVNLSGAAASANEAAEQQVPQTMLEFSSIVKPTTTWGGEFKTMKEFLTYVGNDVHNYWYNVISSKNGIIPPPNVEYYFPLPGEKVSIILCDPYTSTNDETALFCPYLSRIYISQALATSYWEGTYKRNADPSLSYAAGDFSAAMLVAHEYGHNLQAHYISGDYRLLRTRELHADCLAGVWGKSLYQRNELEGNDLYEAMRTLYDTGDYSKLPTEHRGTPAQRYAAFSTGYAEGTMESCSPYANGYAGAK